MKTAGLSMALLQQRSVMRHAIEVPCQIVRERDMKLVARRSIDLSPEGILVPSESDVSLGDELMVSFRASDFGILFAAQGRVARILEGRRAGDRGRCLGVSFRLNAIARHILRGGLRRVPPPIPRRERDRRVDYAKTVRAIAYGVDHFYFDD
ncbi:PilZ domain-containing protein [Pendulispora albinea]|uniref:PilZ domain-containing protein n=1 Tax=Pendulispora albinea TaxID=2741071 RepID=A0ABZ2MCA0_9BACT